MSRLSAWLAGAVDAVRVARSLGMEPDPWQAKLLRSNAARIHLCAGRQVGKSTAASVMALARALYYPGSLVLIVSPTQRQSSELFRQVIGRYRSLGRPVDSESENQLSLTLENGSRVISAPGTETGLRGFTVDLLLCDEASRVDDEIFASLSPMVAVSKGRIVALSTPWGKRGWFYEASEARGWEHYRVPSTECSRINADFLEQERATLGDLVYRSEYLAEFVDAAGMAFSGDDISAIFEAPAPPRPPALPAREDRPAPLSPRQAELARMNRALVGLHSFADVSPPKPAKGCDHRWRGDTCVFCCGVTEDPCSASA
ncbi:MAG TPA: terminase family protein [Acidimicrobiales bacterium]|nr:terminase family protein [Acidimicrobiales bacterium]